ncbi:MAG: hypothetical protein GF398_19560 [Chitinivibrionales bacterium]|nr:hypothetical protein [Chitinivibrionales bacterium]
MIKRIYHQTNRALISCIGGLLLAGCTDIATTDKDILELEIVWQYLKIYSIPAPGKDAVPDNPLLFDTPRQLAHSINDTLYNDSVFYTDYFYSPGIYLTDNALITGSQQNFATVETKLLSNRTLYVYIKGFDLFQTFDGEVYSTAGELVAIAQQQAIPENIILDLRSNPGGLIEVCTSVVDLFIEPQGAYLQATYKTYNSSTKDTATIPWEIWRANQTGTSSWQNKNVVLLFNANSASAAEIMAAALIDAHGAKTFSMGQPTFGKGIGQIHIQRPGGYILSVSSLRFRRYLSDSSAAIYHKKGIAPDTLIAVEDLEDDALLLDLARQKLEGAGFPARRSNLPLHLSKERARLAALNPSGYVVVPSAELPPVDTAAP